MLILEIAGGILLAWLIFVVVGGIILEVSRSKPPHKNRHQNTYWRDH
jgi:hypothetical protein